MSFTHIIINELDENGGSVKMVAIDHPLLLEFPRDKARIGKLAYDQKMEWYAYQFQRNPGVYPMHLITAEFARFWKWRVVVPMKVKRFYYRVKNGEIFKRYQHISEIKKNKPHTI